MKTCYLLVDNLSDGAGYAAQNMAVRHQGKVFLINKIGERYAINALGQLKISLDERYRIFERIKYLFHAYKWKIIERLIRKKKYIGFRGLPQIQASLRFLENVKSGDLIIVMSGGVLALEHYSEIKKRDAKLYLYPMDYSLITGGCYYKFGCDQNLNMCLDCPHSSPFGKKIISSAMKKRIEAYKYIDGLISETYNFLDHAATLFKKYEINSKAVCIGLASNYLDYCSKLKIHNENKFTILIACHSIDNVRKGGKLLYKFLQILCKNQYKNKSNNQIKIVFIGNCNILKKTVISNLLKINKIQFSFEKIMSLEKLQTRFSMASLFLSLSIEDLGPTTLVDAVRMKVPVLSFDIGIASDLIIDGLNGYKVSHFDLNEMCCRLYEICNNHKKFMIGASKAQYIKFERISPDMIFNRLIKFLEE